MDAKDLGMGPPRIDLNAEWTYLLQLATLHERKPGVIILACTPALLGVGDRRNTASFEASLIYIPNSQLARGTY